MTTITDFPEAYPLINEMVDQVYWYALSKEEVESEPDFDPKTASWIDYRYLDYFIELKNGDTYSLTGHTIDQIKEVMEEDDMKSWVETGGVILREINEEWLSNYKSYGFGIGAVLQSKWSGVDEEEC